MLSAAASHKHSGIAIRLNEFFTTASITGLWQTASACTASAVTKARKKVHWKAFAAIFAKAVATARSFIPHSENQLWHGMQAIALDGSKYTLPHTQDIIDTFDPAAGLHNSGKGHYPQCLLMTAYDVLAEIPLHIEVMPVNTSERTIAQTIIGSLPQGAILIHDRGFPSFKYQYFLHHNYNGHYLIRCPATETFPAVVRFMQSSLQEDIITITPSDSFLAEIEPELRSSVLPLTVRALRFKSPTDGTVSVLLTTLLDMELYPYDELVDLYFKRWPIEVHYRNDKCILEIENFHSRNANGIQQEIYAAATVSVIARMLTHIEQIETKQSVHKAMPQFKNAVVCFAMYAAMLVPDDPSTALKIFSRLVDDIKRVRYHKHRKPRSTQPRICKKPPNKWSQRNRSGSHESSLSQ